MKNHPNTQLFMQGEAHEIKETEFMLCKFSSGFCPHILSLHDNTQHYKRLVLKWIAQSIS